MGFWHSSFDKCNTYNMTSKQLVERANSISEQTGNATVLYIAAATEEGKCCAPVAGLVMDGNGGFFARST